mmetsp:Transcript_29541/g.28271  ORF Transcript_29541/g.28271 Transcript_29541/m.28271 type:complete len:233 (+) Transcript_29541:56-754(+)|eukprot:CAMPEP_0119034168 /NCGR_PEP_ID=MMETSP1177-20130426/1192_1 /TAXON_ID=2985 /ORGANISM="Ochromonas sp, Strain CCMP1899" /LENGTH=232 /DNA_ID=CAMNT_0006991429 /DNA_START=56 /DNA_END=754 /DNA_ORIENTATION=-
MYDVLLNAGLGGTVAAAVSLMAVYFIKKNKLKVSEIRIRDDNFRPQKKLSPKDDVFLRMLECCQRTCYVITDPALRDNPIVHASSGFCGYTGYSKGEIEGRNCKFLQGADTDPRDVCKIAEAIRNREEVSVCLLNYKKDRTTFLNQFFLTPLYGEDGEVAYFIGVQSEVPSKSHYPGKERTNQGFKMFRYFESNIKDTDVLKHKITPLLKHKIFAEKQQISNVEKLITEILE